LHLQLLQTLLSIPGTKKVEAAYRVETHAFVAKLQGKSYVSKLDSAGECAYDLVCFCHGLFLRRQASSSEDTIDTTCNHESKTSK
jgi:hypothetical protein